MAKRGRNRHLSKQQGANAPPAQGGFAVQVQGTHYSGPLPPPEILAKFDQVLPGSAERIIAMAERNQAHRHTLEETVIPANVRNERRGQIIAGIIYLATLGCGTFLVYVGRDTAGLVTMLSTTVTFAGLFLYSRRKKEEDLGDKRNR
jgi:uncharacterized membrane protein